VVAFEDEDGLGEYADALWAGADFGRGAPVLEGGEATFGGAADAVDHPVVGFLIGGQASSLVWLASSPPAPLVALVAAQVDLGAHGGQQYDAQSHLRQRLHLLSGLLSSGAVFGGLIGAGRVVLGATAPTVTCWC